MKKTNFDKSLAEQMKEQGFAAAFRTVQAFAPWPELHQITARPFAAAMRSDAYVALQWLMISRTPVRKANHANCRNSSSGLLV
jgi:hypothetical protein